MTQKKRLKALAKLRPYVRELTDLMKLRDWEITLQDEIAERGALAQMCLIYGRNSARMRLGEKFFDDSPEQQRATICHELTHCHFAPMDNALRNALKGMAYEFYLETFERGVDEVGSLIALSMPLPPK